MNEISILIGGKAGDGIDKASLIISHILNQSGYYIYIYRDYPSIIRGGHTFSIIRASLNKIATHLNKVDFILALNQDSLNLHGHRLKDNTFIIYDSDAVKSAGREGLGVPVSAILKEENAPALTRNSCLVGCLGKVVGIKWDILEKVFRENISKEIDLNLKVALRGYKAASELISLDRLPEKDLPLFTGNEAIGLGLIAGGLNAYIAYPMTPTSAILHFLAEAAEKFSLQVIHPESEIAVILMAMGFAYAGKRVAAGTSGGGFCLMTEGLSFAGMAEVPVVIVVGQRTGPSTGLPTYTGQTELHFVLNAGQGEFPRLVVAPGDAEEAYFWSIAALNLAWKYQIPAIILLDKTLAEGTYSFELDSVAELRAVGPSLWDRKNFYKRYLNTDSGVSPLAFAGDKEAVIKVNSYEHDESGITTEEPDVTRAMADKRLRKEKYLARELEGYPGVAVYGNKNSPVAILCWGSNKAVCVEIAQKLGLKVIQPVVLSPFPVRELQEALKGVERLINVENNATAQLIRLIRGYGFKADETILKYDGRPFSLDELGEELKKLIK